MGVDITGGDWGFFAVLLFSLLFLDLWLHRDAHVASKKEVAVWSCIWIAVGLAFSLYVQYRWGVTSRNEYVAAYLIEKALSVDNLFVFLLIFGAMRIPLHNQHAALTWGIFGALAFRAVFVTLGATVLHRWAGVGVLFAAFLFWAGIQSFFAKSKEEEENRLVRWLSKHLPISSNPDTTKFIVREGGKLKLTPILIAIIALELTDIVFAVDSVPAALSFSDEIFIVYSSNAFAILGLRALYVLIAELVADLKYLHYGLAGVLVFAGLKMLAHSCNTVMANVASGRGGSETLAAMCKSNDSWLSHFEVEPMVSIIVIVVFIGGAAVASLFKRKKEKR